MRAKVVDAVGRPRVGILAIVVAAGAASYALADSTTGRTNQQTGVTSVRVLTTSKPQFRAQGAQGVNVEVARLTVPRGRYLVMAKFVAGPAQAETDTLSCDLLPGGSSDKAIVSLTPATSFLTAAMHAVRSIKATGPIRLRCVHPFQSGDTPLSSVRITAIRVPRLTIVPAE